MNDLTKSKTRFDLFSTTCQKYSMWHTCKCGQKRTCIVSQPQQLRCPNFYWSHTTSSVKAHVLSSRREYCSAVLLQISDLGQGRHWNELARRLKLERAKRNSHGPWGAVTCCSDFKTSFQKGWFRGTAKGQKSDVLRHNLNFSSWSSDLEKELVHFYGLIGHWRAWENARNGICTPQLRVAKVKCNWELRPFPTMNETSENYGDADDSQ